MAIDTKSLTELISDFRKITAKDAITPESLGYILQRITDLLATAGTSETITKIQDLLDGFKTAGQAICTLEQGAADRNHILSKIKTVDLSTGAVNMSAGNVFIQQATTERAGAMRAQQVIDLNAAKKNITELTQQLELLKTQVDSGMSASGSSRLYVSVVNGRLRVFGHSALLLKGYVPYLFRHTRKRNRFCDRQASPSQIAANTKYCKPRRGWNLFGSVHMVKIMENYLYFSTMDKSQLALAGDDFSESPMTLLSLHQRPDGKEVVAWGRSTISLNSRKNPQLRRLIKLRFAIGLGPKYTPCRKLITPAHLVTNLAEFAVIFDPGTGEWTFGRP